MKLTGTKKIMGGLALAGTLMLTGVVGFAQQGAAQGQDGKEHAGRHGKGRGGRGGMRGGFHGPFGRLNLTDAQKEQMKQIATRYHEAAKAQRGTMRGERRGGGFDPSTGVFDEAAVRAAAQARANARVEQEVSRARMMSEMYNVLTAEQKAQLATERQQREQKRQERRSRRGVANPGQSM
ncbi:MAG TPA: Spy/CpxP family protein refolding chaperone [Pyrinomonadaceae bacterium]|nr:Spy/CpxP family protein refolding chaperone [Pyrinomonadaceae bacterium]